MSETQCPRPAEAGRMHRTMASAAALLLNGLLAAGEAWSGTVPRPVVLADWMGMNVPYEIHPVEAYPAQLAALRELGIRHVRAPIHWNILEPSRGVLLPEFTRRIDAFHRACAVAGIGILLYPAGSPVWNTTAPVGGPMADRHPPRDAAPYLEHLAWLAGQPAVEAMQVWNEPNIPGFWAPREDPQGYGDLLAAALLALRRGSPGLLVFTAGMAYWSAMPLRGGYMFTDLAGRGLLAAVDGCAYHPYLNRPEGDDGQPPTSFSDTAALVNAHLRAAGAVRVWATEVGWSTYPGPLEEQPLIDEATQAAYLVRRLLLLLASDVDRVYWFALSDFPAGWQGRDASYGLVRADGTRKPAFAALARLLALAGPRLSPAAAVQSSGPEPRFCVAMTRADGSRLVGLWALAGGRCRLADIAAATVLDPVSGAEWRVEDAAGISVDLTAGVPLLIAVRR